MTAKRSPGRRVRELGQVFSLASRDFLVDKCMDWAGAIAFYALLSLFPLLIAAVAIAGYVVEPQWAVAQVTRWLGDFLPEAEEQVAGIIKEALEGGGAASLLSLVILLWSGSHVFGIMSTALNLAFDSDEHHTFGRRLLVQFVMLFVVGLLMLLVILAPWLMQFGGRALGITGIMDHPVAGMLVVLVPSVLLFAALTAVYRFVPGRRPDLAPALFGAAIATLLFVAARPLFEYYLQQFGTLNVIYGFLAIAITLLLWIWVAGLILLFGGELVSHSQALMVEGMSVEEIEERHLARSPDRRQEVEKRKQARR
jgi:membrane protein